MILSQTFKVFLTGIENTAENTVDPPLLFDGDLEFLNEILRESESSNLNSTGTFVINL